MTYQEAIAASPRRQALRYSLDALWISSLQDARAICIVPFGFWELPPEAECCAILPAESIPDLALLRDWEPVALSGWERWLSRFGIVGELLDNLLFRLRITWAKIR